MDNPIPDFHQFLIPFENGSGFLLHPVDPEAEAVVSRIGSVMSLSTGRSGYPIYISVNKFRFPFPVTDIKKESLICSLSSESNSNSMVFQMAQLALFIAFQTLPHGGLLIHGALIERNGQGIILTGPSGVGKTTACNRVPLPWHTLSDDLVLVMPDQSGWYVAHPWPTWFVFFNNGPGGSWDVTHAVKLQGIFILSRAPEDGIEKITRDESLTYLIDALRLVTWPLRYSDCSQEDKKSLYMEILEALDNIIQTVPVHILRISLTGKFWEELSSWLDVEERMIPAAVVFTGSDEPDIPLPRVCEDTDSPDIPIIYHGTDMQPILQEYDLLEVAPYGNHCPAIGDLICFSYPEQTKRVIHRIIAISNGEIRTQGDTNPLPDAQPIRQQDIIGRVIGVRRGKNHYRISGGLRGRISFRYARIRSIMVSWILNSIKVLVHYFWQYRHHLPERYQPRMYLFSSTDFSILRLMYGKRVIGRYHQYMKRWVIEYPFRFFISADDLPVIDYPFNNNSEPHQVSE